VKRIILALCFALLVSIFILAESVRAKAGSKGGSEADTASRPQSSAARTPDLSVAGSACDLASNPTNATCLDAPDGGTAAATQAREISIADMLIAQAKNALATLPPDDRAANPAEVLNALQAIDLAAFRLGTCAEKSGGTADSRAKLDAAVTLQSEVLRRLTHACTAQASATAERSFHEAYDASSNDVAQAAADRAADAVIIAQKLRSRVSDAINAAASAQAENWAALAQHEMDVRSGAKDSICKENAKGRPQTLCGTYGMFAATLSYVMVWNSFSDFSGATTRPHLPSVAVPDVALRWLPSQDVGWVALEIGAYTSFLTQSLTAASPSVTKVACTRNASEYENRLPCEANANVYPYLALYLGATVGKAGIGYLTVAPVNFGIAQVGSSSALRPYFGITVGALQLNGKF
jgi:hypothetical protein